MVLSFFISLFTHLGINSSLLILRPYLILSSSGLHTQESREILLYLLRNCCISGFHFTGCVCRADRCSRHSVQRFSSLLQRKLTPFLAPLTPYEREIYLCGYYAVLYSNIHEFLRFCFSITMVATCTLTLYYGVHPFLSRDIKIMYDFKGVQKGSMFVWTPL